MAEAQRLQPHGKGELVPAAGPLLSVNLCSGGRVSTSRVAEEKQAPDAGGAADDQASGQHGTVRHLPAQPAHEEEAQDDLHPAQAVHQAVAQLPETEVALRQRSHHGLGEGKESVRGSTRKYASISQTEKKKQPPLALFLLTCCIRFS